MLFIALYFKIKLSYLYLRNTYKIILRVQYNILDYIFIYIRAFLGFAAAAVERSDEIEATQPSLLYLG